MIFVAQASFLSSYDVETSGGNREQAKYRKILHSSAKQMNIMMHRLGQVYLNFHVLTCSLWTRMLSIETWLTTCLCSCRFSTCNGDHLTFALECFICASPSGTIVSTFTSSISSIMYHSVNQVHSVLAIACGLFTHEQVKYKMSQLVQLEAQRTRWRCFFSVNTHSLDDLLTRIFITLMAAFQALMFTIINIEEKHRASTTINRWMKESGNRRERYSLQVISRSLSFHICSLSHEQPKQIIINTSSLSLSLFTFSRSLGTVNRWQFKSQVSSTPEYYLPAGVRRDSSVKRRSSCLRMNSFQMRVSTFTFFFLTFDYSQLFSRA